jgi:DNA helicase II / ATP-dependent DNA helicase PcrA
MTVDNAESSSDFLNPAQRLAVEHVDGPLLIIAGPGSGKTRVIVHRIARMIEKGIPSHQIAAMTFTNKAADEMRNRLNELSPGHLTWTGTFHRFCSRLLRTYASFVGLHENFTIYDTADSKKAFRIALAESGIPVQNYSPEQLLGRIGRAKNNGLVPETFAGAARSHLDKVAAAVYPHYQKYLLEANAVDFDDMLLHVVTMLRDNAGLREMLDERFRYLIVDEYQDTNTSQYLIIKGLSQIHRNLCVTGDPDQSIYGWRGASLDNILDFEKDFSDVTVIRLEQNYRSTRSILAVADQLIVNNQRRKHKNLVTDNEEGIPVTLVSCTSGKEEADLIADAIAWHIRSGAREPGDFAVFYRVNALSRSFEHAFQLLGIPYQVVHGQEFYQRSEVKDLLAWLSLLNNPSDNLALERIINVPPRKIGHVTVNRIRDHAADQGISLLEACRRAGLNPALSGQAANKIAAFVSIYDQLAANVSDSVEEILGQVIERTRYRTWLEEDDSEEGHSRLANIDELLNATREFDMLHPEDGGLQSYLETAVLINETDSLDSRKNAVTLMTLHAAKGLEFPVVFIVGVEEGLLPHERSVNDDSEIEEERRLLFVGITRAREELQLSRSLYRFRRGASWPTIASRFLMELPRHKMTIVEPQGPAANDSEFDYRQDDDFSDEPWFAADADSKGDDDNADRVRSQPSPYLAPQAIRALTGPVSAKKELVESRPVIQTAEQLFLKKAAQESEPRIPSESFFTGMLVTHPQYGTGRVIVLGGQGRKRMGTVEFFDGSSRKFVLAASPLRPAGDVAEPG